MTAKKDDSLALCSIKTFAEMSGVTVEEAINWADSGAIPLPSMPILTSSWWPRSAW